MENKDWMSAHICQKENSACNGMKEFYSKAHIIPTSTAGDTLLIRSHIAYWSGAKTAEAALIAPSRGNSYKVNGTIHGDKIILKIVDYYDHREGIVGWK